MVCVKGNVVVASHNNLVHVRQGPKPLVELLNLLLLSDLGGQEGLRIRSSTL